MMKDFEIDQNQYATGIGIKENAENRNIQKSHVEDHAFASSKPRSR